MKKIENIIITKLPDDRRPEPSEYAPEDLKSDPWYQKWVRRYSITSSDHPNFEMIIDATIAPWQPVDLLSQVYIKSTKCWSVFNHELPYYTVCKMIAEMPEHYNEWLSFAASLPPETPDEHPLVVGEVSAKVAVRRLKKLAAEEANPNEKKFLEDFIQAMEDRRTKYL